MSPYLQWGINNIGATLHYQQSRTKLIEQFQEIKQKWTGRETSISVFVKFLTTSTKNFFWKGDWLLGSFSTYFLVLTMISKFPVSYFLSNVFRTIFNIPLYLC